MGMSLPLEESLRRLAVGRSWTGYNFGRSRWRRKWKMDLKNRPLCPFPKLAAALMLSLLAHPTRGFQQSAPAALRQYHIEVTLPLGLSATHMTERDFSVVQGGKSIPIRLRRFKNRSDVLRYGLPPHLLVAFLHAKRPDDRLLLRMLRSPLMSGWLVSVQRVDGTFTSYCATAACIELSLAKANGSDPTSDSMNKAFQIALDWLNIFAGRRVLITMPPHSSREEQMLSVEERILGLAYIVDGGLVKLAESLGSYPGPSVPKYAHYDQYDMQCRAHEKTLANAIRNAVADDRKYYDLQVDLRKSQDALEEGANLVIHGAAGSTVCADLYSIQPGTVDGEPVSLRHPESSNLAVSEK